MMTIQPKKPVRAISEPSRVPVLVTSSSHTEPISTTTPANTAMKPRISGSQPKPAMTSSDSIIRLPRRRSRSQGIRSQAGLRHRFLSKATMASIWSWVSVGG